MGYILGEKGLLDVKVLFIISLLIKLFVILHPINYLIDRYLSDDAFYYFEIARNVATGHGVVATEGIPTNGFHPLYLLVLVLLYKIAAALSSDSLLIYIYLALILNVLLFSISGLFLFDLIKRYFNEFVALIISFVWFFNPFLFHILLRGVETSFQLFFTILFIWYASKKNKLISLLALIGVLLILSRMDGIFLVGSYALVELVKNYNKNNKKWVKYILRNISIYIIIIFIGLSPWLYWSFTHFGTVSPLSGLAARQLHLINKTSLLFNIGILGWWFFRFILSPYFLWSLIISIIFLGFILFILIKHINEFIQFVHSFDYVLIAFLFWLLFYLFYIQGFRIWYFAFILVFFMIIILPFIINILTTYYQLNRKGIWLFILLLTILNTLLFELKPRIYSELIKYNIAMDLVNNKYNIPKLGSFNSGIYTYFLHDKILVYNLDGVVNPEAYYAIKGGRFCNYLKTNDIKYIVDPKSTLDYLDQYNISYSIIKRYQYSNSMYYLVKIDRFGC